MKRDYYKVVYKTKQEWLAHRKCGGTSASAIIGCNPYMSAMDLYRAIKFPKAKNTDEQNESMRYGVKCEPILRDMFRLDFGDKYRVERPNIYAIYFSKKYPFMSASLDGILTDKSNGDKYVFECKTHDVRGRDDYEEWNGHLPQHYFTQCCHYLLVMNDFKGTILKAKLRFFNAQHEIERQEIRYYKILRNEVSNSLINLEKAEIKFFTNVENNIPPKVKIAF